MLLSLNYRQSYRRRGKVSSPEGYEEKGNDLFEMNLRKTVILRFKLHKKKIKFNLNSRRSATGKRVSNQKAKGLCCGDNKAKWWECYSFKTSDSFKTCDAQAIYIYLGPSRPLAHDSEIPKPFLHGNTDNPRLNVCINSLIFLHKVLWPSSRKFSLC